MKGEAKIDVRLQLFSQHALTVCGSVGFEQAETVVGTLRPVSETFQHAEIGDVEGGGQQVSHLTHKLGQNDLFYTKQGEQVKHPPHFHIIFLLQLRFDYSFSQNTSCSGHIRAGLYIA